MKDDNHAAPDLLSKFRGVLELHGRFSGPQEIQSDMILIQQRRLGAPFKPYLWLEWDTAAFDVCFFCIWCENPSYSPLEPEAASG